MKVRTVSYLLRDDIGAPGRIRTSVFSLGTLQSGRVFDQLRGLGERARAIVIPQPSQDCGPLAVNDGQMAGGDV